LFKVVCDDWPSPLDGALRRRAFEGVSMRITASLVAIAMLPALVGACGTGNNEGTGTIVGALAGGVVGHQFGKGSGNVAATVGGAVIGGIIGNQIGHDMDERDRRMAAAAEYRALEYGQTGSATPWNNPATRHRGQIVPGQYYSEGGRFCRPYTHTIYIDGAPETARGTACREQNGTWRSVG
jgi:surface antigen